MNVLSAIDRLLLDVAEGRRQLTSAELGAVLEHVSRVGFSLRATERVRGRLRGQIWQGRELKGSDRLPPAEVHFLTHAVARQEWPLGTDQQGYITSIRQVIRDPASGVFLNRYQTVRGLGVVRRSRHLRGPGGADWVLVQYRLGWGHWITAYQPTRGLEELDAPAWSDIQWLQQPTNVSGR